MKNYSFRQVSEKHIYVSTEGAEQILDIWVNNGCIHTYYKAPLNTKDEDLMLYNLEEEDDAKIGELFDKWTNSNET